MMSEERSFNRLDSSVPHMTGRSNLAEKVRIPCLPGPARRLLYTGMRVWFNPTGVTRFEPG